MSKIEIDIARMITEDAAAKVIATLSEENRKEIIRRFVMRNMDDVGRDINWKIKGKMEADAVEYAMQYIATAEAQAVLKEKAIEAAKNYFDKIAEVIPKTIEKHFKSKYHNLFPEER